MMNPNDSYRRAALAATALLAGAHFVTTEEILLEVLAALRSGAHLRSLAVALIHELHARPDVEVVPQSSQSFAAGLARYANRPDKENSLVDCISMETMDARGIKEALTHDRHLQQEGCTIA